MTKYIPIDKLQYENFYVVRHVFPNIDLAENESQYAILSKSANKTFNPGELFHFIATSDNEALEIALQYAKENRLV